MDDETFWNLIDACRQETPVAPDERLAWLRGRLSQMSQMPASDGCRGRSSGRWWADRLE
ncbi:hypothetical protein [Streptomyces sp. NPDC004135]